MLSFGQFAIAEAQSPEEIASEWKEHAWNRRGMTAMAKKAVKGGPLHHLHPGNVTVHRGVSAGSASHKKVGTSWTKHKTVAADYANGGTIHTTKIDVHTPAIDVNKITKGSPSKSTKDHEVFVASGNHKLLKKQSKT